jgi:hypothetical protein
VEQQVLEKQRVLEQPLERFGKRDSQPGFAFVRCDFFQALYMAGISIKLSR